VLVAASFALEDILPVFFQTSNKNNQKKSKMKKSRTTGDEILKKKN